MDSSFVAPAKLTKEAEPAGACPMADGRAAKAGTGGSENPSGRPKANGVRHAGRHAWS
jgi:hypothetical protein